MAVFKVIFGSVYKSRELERFHAIQGHFFFCANLSFDSKKFLSVVAQDLDEFKRKL